MFMKMELVIVSTLMRRTALRKELFQLIAANDWIEQLMIDLILKFKNLRNYICRAMN